MSHIFAPVPAPAVPVEGKGDLSIHRIFCVGRNYAAHAAEMGNEVDREAPFYFTKSAHAAIPSGSSLPYPPGTADLHHEIELVLAIGSHVGLGQGGEDAVLAYGIGLDMTRRDLQAAAKERRRPWSTGKDFEGSAVLAPMVVASECGKLAEARIALAVNGAGRQQGRIADMVWSVDELVRDLSRFYHLRPGDLIMTGTPSGVGAVVPGDRLEGRIDGLPHLTLEIAPPE